MKNDENTPFRAENTVFHVISPCENPDDLDFTNIQNKRQAKMLCTDGAAYPALIGDIPYVKGQVSFFSTPRFRIDLTGWDPDDSWLRFFFYVSDPTAFTGCCQIELSSSGRCDVEEANWNSLGNLHRGWNEFLLSFRDASVSGGVFNRSSVNWFRFYYYLTKDVTVGISRLEIVTVPKAGFSTPADTLLRAGEELNVPTTAGTVRASSSVLALSLCGVSEGTKLALSLTDPKNRDASLTVSVSGRDASLNLPLDTFEASPGFSFPEITGITLKALNGEAKVLSVGICGIEVAVEREIEALLSRAPVTPENADAFVPAILSAKEKVKQVFTAVAAVEKRTANVWLPSYMAFNELSKTAEEYASSENGVWISCGDAAPGGRLPVTVKNCTSETLSGLKLKLTASRFLLGKEMPEVVLPVLAPGASAKTELRFRPLTGGVWKGEISVSDCEKTLGSVSRFLRLGGRGWYTGDLHIHSVRSDGKGTPAMNFYTAWERGDSFLYMTDHNQKIGKKEDMEEGVSFLRRNGINGFQPLKGCEITVYGPSGHALAFNSAVDRVSPPTGRTEADIAGWNDIFADIRSHGGLTYLAHPFCRWFNFPGMTTGVMADYDGDWLNEGWLTVRDGVFYTVSDAIPLYRNFHGVEIMNFDCYRNEKHYYLDPCLEYWDRMNILGIGKFFGSCGTDAHDPADIARCKNRFLLPAPRVEAVNNALGNGSFYPSSGPLLSFETEKADGTPVGMGGTVIAKAGEKGKLRIAAESGGSPITKVTLIRCTIVPGLENNLQAYENRTVTELLDPAAGPVPFYETEVGVTLTPGEFYRLEVRTERFEEAAFSNPIWVSSGAARLCVRENCRNLTLRRGESGMLFFATDDLLDTPVLTSDTDALTLYDYGKIEVKENAAPGEYRVFVRSTSGKEDAVTVKVTE